MIIALFILGFVAVGLITMSALIARVPFGYEDAAGFHYGQENVHAVENATWVMTEAKTA